MVDLNVFTEKEVAELEKKVDWHIKHCYRYIDEYRTQKALRKMYEEEVETLVLIKAKLVNKKNNENDK